MKIKYLLACFISLSLIESSFAQDDKNRWEIIHADHDNHSTYFIDTKQRGSDYVWLSVVHMSEKFTEDGKKYNWEYPKIKYNCESYTFAVISNYQYNYHPVTHKSDLVKSFNFDDSKMKPPFVHARPDSAFEKVLDEICKK